MQPIFLLLTIRRNGSVVARDSLDKTECTHNYEQKGLQLLKLRSVLQNDIIDYYLFRRHSLAT